MKSYAMICNNKVIEVLHKQLTEPIWPADPAGNAVTAVPCAEEATINWLYNPETGEVYEPEYKEPETPPPPQPQPTEFEQLMEAVSKSHEELRQEGATALTMELIERGIL